MTQEQIEVLYDAWNYEDQDDAEWYDSLTEEERALVDQWDAQYYGGVLRLCEDILKKENAQ